MTTEKKQLLDRTFQTFMDVGFRQENLSLLDEIVAKDVVGFGTAVDEKLFGVKELQRLLVRQKEQSAGMQTHWKINTLDVHISSDENTAIYTNDLQLYLTVDGNTIEMYMRFSVVLEYVQSKWLVVHWHGSKPEQVESEKDTWGLETWKAKAEELEKQVADRTADLVVKNRELEIEAALERVRSTSLSMQSSEDLGKVVFVVFTELIQLDAQLDRCLILIVDPQTLGITWYLTGKEGLLSNNGFLVPDNTHPSHQAYLEGWRTKRKKWQYLLAGEEKQGWDAFGFTETELARLPDFIKADMSAIEAIHLTISSDNFGCLIASSLSPLSETHAGIVERFAIVFNQTYTRFLDLQKAEAQAREAQIEAALERVRSRSMAMRNSSELKEVIGLVLQQFVLLNINAEHAGFYIDYKAHDDMHIWLADPNIEPFYAVIPYFDTPTWNSFLDAKANGTTLHTDLLDFNTKNKFYKSLFKLFKVPEEAQEFYLQCNGLAVSTVLLDNVGLYIENFSAIPYTDAENEILIRIGKVFQQTYLRFLDLQKAEAQAKEAQIEAALERVRAASMAMHKSNELSNVAFLLFEEFKRLNPLSATQLSRAFVVTLEESKELFTFFLTTTEGAYLPTSYPLPFGEPTNGMPLAKCWREHEEELINVLTGDIYRKWLEYLDQINLYVSPEIRNMEKRVNNYIRFSKGFLGITSLEPLSREELLVLKRFAKAFDQTYTRFLDLQQAEANAREATRRASIERVRGEIASMRTPDDLKRITPLVWNELTALGVPFFRCGVFIINEGEAIAHVYLSTPEGKSIARLHLPFGSSQLVEDAVARWRKQEVYKAHWGREDFQAWVQTLVQQGHLKSDEQYNAGNEAPEHLWLQYIPFAQGMLYIGSDHMLNDEHIALVQVLAEAFAAAYARYEDFNKLEAAKNEVDKTLQELKLTQDQLIQAEKLASLGQLTAGIAHEIKNPLNFINNFSDVSVELIDEVLAEMQQSDLSETKTEIIEILNSVKSNLNIIHQHGSRADGIVKSMLMHSRSSTGRKEPTDLNAMVRENVNLAFHAMRAAKHPMNVEIVLELDDTVGEVALIIEDFSRVILNLCNNAMDAMREKVSKYEKQSTKYEGFANGEIEPYKPKLIVRTRRIADQVFIEVEDNGPGIAAEIRDKILQPFFTTKKGTQGTGLGLSITHDIIKAHGGILEIESVLETYSKFIITLT